MIGIITCKKRNLHNDPYTYGDLYMDNDIVVTVKKAIYDQFHIGDEVRFDYTDHVSFSGVKFHNLTDIQKIGERKFNLDKASSKPLNSKEMEFYMVHQSKFFYWIKIAFFSLVLFFIEMYFTARFELDVLIQQSTGKSYLLIIMFLFLFSINFVVLIPIFYSREKSRIKKLLIYTRSVKAIEFVQNSDYCDFYYQDSIGTGNTQIAMKDFHKVKNNPVLNISFINNELFYKLSVSEDIH